MEVRTEVQPPGPELRDSDQADREGHITKRRIKNE